MNENRTYGIEMEMASSKSREELAQIIQNAIYRFGHTCTAAGYHHSTNGLNRTAWEVKSDASINTEAGFYNQAEVVTPVLKGKRGLEILKAVCEAIEPHVKINRSCGLHVHHAVAQDEDLRKVVNGWIRIEKTVMLCLPKSRRNNKFCKRIAIKGLIPENTSVRNWWIANRMKRYSALNLESYWLRQTVEIRCHSGSVDFEKVSNWTLATQAFVERSLQDKIETNLSITKLVNVIKGEQSGRPVELQMPAAGTKVEVIINKAMLGWSLDQINYELKERFEASKDYKSFIKTYLYRTFKGRITQRAGRFEIAEATASGNTDQDFAIAADWIQSRFSRFGEVVA